jgi:hypothetical protein
MPMPDNFERFGRKVDESFKDVVPKIEYELKRVVSYINDEVVPEVRREGSDALRAAADQLKKLADYMEQQRKNSAQ